MQNRKTTDKINEISIVPNLPNYSIVVLASQRAPHLHFATDNQLAKPCILTDIVTRLHCVDLPYQLHFYFAFASGDPLYLGLAGTAHMNPDKCMPWAVNSHKIKNVT